MGKEWRFVRVMRASSSSSSSNIWKRHTGREVTVKENETALASRQVVVVVGRRCWPGKEGEKNVPHYM